MFLSVLMISKMTSMESIFAFCMMFFGVLNLRVRVSGIYIFIIGYALVETERSLDSTSSCCSEMLV